MRTLGALEASYADENVPLALVLGAIGALSAVRRLLPPEPVSRGRLPLPAPHKPDAVGTQPEPFVALLLGAIATHERLLSLFGPRFGERTTSDAAVAAGGGSFPLEGLLR